MKAELSLKEFLERKAKIAPDLVPAVDTASILSEWQEALEKLFSSIESWIPESNEVVLTREPHEIEEEHLGVYPVEHLVLKVATQAVRIRPKGRLIVGARGRVDILGEKGIATIIRRNDQWERLCREPTLHFCPFDESALAQILEAVMN